MSQQDIYRLEFFVNLFRIAQAKNSECKMQQIHLKAQFPLVFGMVMA